MENRRALCYNNVLHQSESKIGGICFGTSNHCDLPGGAEPAVGSLPRNRKLLECAGAHAPCLCRYLRLPAERGGFRAHPRHAARVRLSTSSDTEEGADCIVINTCAIREHAETRVYGNVGALVHTKARHPAQKIFLCGCMMGQPAGRRASIKNSYRHVDGVFNPAPALALPGASAVGADRAASAFLPSTTPQAISPEGIPVVRASNLKAWVVDHVRLQQFLFVLHRPLRARARAVETTGGDPGRGQGPRRRGL